MSFGEAIRSAYRKYAVFRGRAPRSEFWWFYLFWMLVSIPASFSGITDAIWTLGNLAPFVAVTARRLHDTDRSGWRQLLPLAGAVLAIASAAMRSDWLTYAGLAVALGLGILLIVRLASPGTAGPNRFDDGATGQGDAEIFS